jgi:hypothetical protein
MIAMLMTSGKIRLASDGFTGRNRRRAL